eukprot:gene18250-13114_t
MKKARSWRKKRASQEVVWPEKREDFFPYSDASQPASHTFWTGYFTSRRQFEYFERYDTSAGSVAVYYVDPSSYTLELLGDVDSVVSPQAGDLFGYAVCISSDGQTIAASSPGKSLGYVYVLALSSFGAGHSWSIVGEVGVTTSTTESGFGTTLSMDASGTAFVMASYTSYGNMGYLEVYQYSSTYQNWAQTGYQNTGATSAFLGRAVSIQAVGDELCGHIYGTRVNGQFGYALAFLDDGTTLIASEMSPIHAYGRVFVYSYNGT